MIELTFCTLTIMKKINLLVSKFATKRLAGMTLGASVCAVAIASTILPQKASAQALTPVQTPSNVTSQQSEKDTMYGQSGDFNVMNLIHRSQMGTGELTDPSKSISDAATRFRLEQQRQLNQPSSSGNLQPQLPQNPATNSQPSN
jgi:hypothetical protein